MSDAPQHTTLLYDDACPLCTFQSRVITWLDWFNTVAMLPLSHDNAAAMAGDITRQDLREAIHCFTPEPDARVHRGARALRHIGMRMPLTIPIALILWIPGVIYLAEMFYKFGADRRQTLSKLLGCEGACEIMPARDRDLEKDAAEPSKPALSIEPLEERSSP